MIKICNICGMIEDELHYARYHMSNEEKIENNRKWLE